MYIVRSTLDPSLIKLAYLPDRDISNQEKEDGIPEDLVSESILSWQAADQIPSYGILFVILSLILVHGKTIPDSMYPLNTRLYSRTDRIMYSSPQIPA
jgi:melanoma-associated antigen